MKFSTETHLAHSVGTYTETERWQAVLSDEDRAYFERRAEEEVVCACFSRDPRAVEFHYQLAELYLEKLYGGPTDTFSDEGG